MTLDLAQTLHGYAQGHRLLARGGDIHETELHELDRLSDLSGYLPADASFTTYHTGFPCGRYFAFASTWPDHDAPRRGTVLTHTLLIPLERWTEHSDPFAWSQLHRRPASVEDLDPYSSPLSDEPTSLPPVSVADAELRGLLALWFGQAERPVLWVDEPPSLHVTRTLWPWLWSELRQTFSFCTFALQPRTRRGRPFDLLMLPPAALGAFHEFGNSSAWWIDGRLRRGEPEPWIDGLIEGGPAAVAALIERCRDSNLPPPRAGMFRAAQRYWELTEGATMRLAAARSRLDMLARVWPRLSPTHPAVAEAVSQLVARQADAPLAPRPLWDLHNMLAQSYVRAQLDEQGAIREQIFECLREQVRERLTHAQATGPALVQLYESAPPPARATLREGIVATARAATGDLTWAGALLDHSETTTDDELGLLLWRELPAGVLKQWMARRFENCSAAQREALRERVIKWARERGSPELARAAWASQVNEGLQAAASVVAERPNVLGSFESVLVQERETDQLAWCLDCQVELLRPMAIRTAVSILRRGKPSLANLASQCEGHPLGAPIFIGACPWAPTFELESVLGEANKLALQIVHFMLEDSTSSSSLASTAGRVVPSLLLWSPATRAALSAGNASVSQLGALVPRLLGDIVADKVPADEAGAWLAEPRVDDWLQRASTWEVGRSMSTRPKDALAKLTAATSHALRATSRLEASLPLGVLLQSVSREELTDGVEELAQLLSQTKSGSPAGLHLRAEVLGALRRYQVPEGWRLVELAFPPVYSTVVRGVELAHASWWRSFSWDRAKHWRHWLLDTWVERSWPAESMIRCLDGDPQLAKKIFKRASRVSAQTRAWLFSLRPAVVRDPGLFRVWEEYAQR